MFSLHFKTKNKIQNFKNFGWSKMDLLILFQKFKILKFEIKIKNFTIQKIM